MKNPEHRKLNSPIKERQFTLVKQIVLETESIIRLIELKPTSLREIIKPV